MDPGQEIERRTEALRYLRGILRLWLERLALGATAGWIGLLLVLCPWIAWRAEHNLLTAFLVYVPPLTALLPLGVLVPLALLSRRRFLLLALLAITVGAYLWLFAGYRLGPASPVAAATVPGTLKLLTYNYGQNGRTSLKPFLGQVDADVIVLQDAGKRGPRYEKDPFYDAWPFVAQEGEFVLLSRHRIREHNSIFVTPLDGNESAPKTKVAARFVVEWEGRRVGIYSVHFPTPRDVLSWYGHRGTFLYGILGVPGTPFAERRRQYEAYWENRVRQAQALAAVAAADPLPKLLAGDLNAPGKGAVYRALRSVFVSDTHAEAGSGFGYTFPGDTRNPAALFRPWMRLDVVLADAAWIVAGSTTETGRRSQHLAVCGALRWRDAALPAAPEAASMDAGP